VTELHRLSSFHQLHAPAATCIPGPLQEIKMQVGRLIVPTVAIVITITIIAALIITFFSGDLSIQPVKFTVDSVPFPTIKMAVISHHFDFPENLSKLPLQPPGLMPCQRATIDSPLYPLLRFMNP